MTYQDEGTVEWMQLPRVLRHLAVCTSRDAVRRILHPRFGACRLFKGEQIPADALLLEELGNDSDM